MSCMKCDRNQLYCSVLRELSTATSEARSSLKASAECMFSKGLCVKQENTEKEKETSVRQCSTKNAREAAKIYEDRKVVCIVTHMKAS